jgi:uncharacterized protein YidB (DUF937 family)
LAIFDTLVFLLSKPAFIEERTMSLLTSVLGAVMGGQQQQNPLLNIALSMLSNNQQGGGSGLAGLLGQFQQAGLGHVADSWIGKGQNMPISGDQLQQILGSGQIGQIAQQLGLSNDQASGQLADLLPSLIDKLTPHGEAPQGGLGDSDAMMKMLQGFMQK